MSYSENSTSTLTARRIYADIRDSGIPEFVVMLKGFRFRRPEDLLAQVNESFIQDAIALDTRLFGDRCLKDAFFCLDSPSSDLAARALQQVEYGVLRLALFAQGLRFLGELDERQETFAGLSASELLGVVTLLLLEGESTTVDLAGGHIVVADDLATVYSSEDRTPLVSLPLAAVETLQVEELLP